MFFVFAVWAYPLSAPSHLARAAARLLGKEVDNTRPSNKLLHLLNYIFLFWALVEIARIYDVVSDLMHN